MALPTVFAAFLAIGLTTGVAHADEEEAQTCVRAKGQELVGQGWSVRTSTTATLAAGEYDVYALTLHQGNSYKVLACGDKEAADLNLVLFDETGARLAADQNRNREPTLDFVPSHTGKYYVMVHAGAMSGAQGKAGVATAVVFK
ncbi:MAG: hypothetical protein H6742_08115 [Alphaproteobacteria bacterium]|nr:hypothetical protein [Alphaproteobacteria bacterium]